MNKKLFSALIPAALLGSATLAHTQPPPAVVAFPAPPPAAVIPPPPPSVVTVPAPPAPVMPPPAVVAFPAPPPAAVIPPPPPSVVTVPAPPVTVELAPVAAVPAGPVFIVEYSTDLPGSNLRPGFPVSDLGQCMNACLDDFDCFSFTLVKPYEQPPHHDNADSLCWLKGSARNKRVNPGMISGIRR